MRWIYFAFVLYGCGSSIGAAANEDQARTQKKHLLLVSATSESREQSLAGGLFFLQKFYEIDAEFKALQIAQAELAEALNDPYDMVVLYALGKLAKEERDALKRFQLDGGSLIWFLQGNADLKFYRSLAGEMDRPLMPACIDEHVEWAEDKAAGIIDFSLLPKELHAVIPARAARNRYRE